MSWLSQGWNAIGRVWDTTMGRDGVWGSVGDITGMWESGGTKRRRLSERDKLGDYRDKIQGREGGIKDYYSALGQLYNQETQAKAGATQFQYRTQQEAIETQGANKMGMLNLVSHGGVNKTTGDALAASNFQYNNAMTALNVGQSTRQLQTDKLRRNELQNLSDMVYQLNQQYKRLS